MPAHAWAPASAPTHNRTQDQHRQAWGEGGSENNCHQSACRMNTHHNTTVERYKKKFSDRNGNSNVVLVYRRTKKSTTVLCIYMQPTKFRAGFDREANPTLYHIRSDHSQPWTVHLAVHMCSTSTTTTQPEFLPATLMVFCSVHQAQLTCSPGCGCA